jgi:HEAT repeat protein
MGPAAEKTLIAIVSSNADSSVRGEACNTLRFVGTRRCIPVLEATAMTRDNGNPVGEAEAALRAIAQRTIASDELAVTLATLRSPDVTERRAALERLDNAVPGRERSAKAARALEKELRAETDEGLQRQALIVLTRWGDVQSAAFLAKLLEDASFRPWREAALALGKLAPGDNTAEVILNRYRDDAGLVIKVIREMRVFPEKAVLKTFLEHPDLNVRRDMGRVLEDKGTDASLPTLETLVKQARSSGLGTVAAEAVRGIHARL